MRKGKLLYRISVSYWKRHKRRLFTLALTIVMGVAALCCSALLIRSEKTAVVSQTMDNVGNYDAIIYETDVTTAETISKMEGVGESGFYHELGYVTLPEGSQEYKAVAYQDTKSQELYHMSCIRGTYPETEDEIALDMQTAKALGIVPYPGEQAELKLYDLEKNALCTKTFTVSGIFTISNEEVEGGYYRYAGKNYVMPTIVLHAGMNEIFDSDVITAYVQIDDNGVNEVLWALESQEDTPCTKVATPYGRISSYSIALGTEFTLFIDYGESSLQHIEQAMEDGKIFRDFYSDVLMPVFCFLILVIVMVSVVGLIRNVLKDRTEMVAILRSLGLSGVESGIYLTVEMLLLTFLLSLAGLVVGMGCHGAMIALLNHLYNLRLETGFQAVVYVKAVTYNPYTMPLLVVGAGVLAAVLISVIRFSRISPIMLFQGHVEHKADKKGRKRTVSGKESKHWMPMLNKSIHLHDTSIIIMMIVVMSAAFFGYTYFSALSDMETTSLRNSLENSSLGNRDYLAERSPHIHTFNFNTENHHDYGIPVEAVREFAENEFVERAYGMIVNTSTRLAYQAEETDESVEQLLGTANIRTRLPGEDEIEMVLYEGQEAFMEAVGYSSEESIYAAPTVGIPEELMMELQDCVIAGEINWEQILSGEEVVIAVPESRLQMAEQVFTVGEELPLSDIVLSAEEDLYDFGYMSSSDVAEPVYESTVIDNGTEVEYSEYAFGYRKDIQTRVGAVVSIPEDAGAENYHDFIYELVYQDLQAYPVTVLCADRGSFQAWELPDALYTKVSVNVADGYDTEQLDVEWYRFLNGAPGMRSYTVSETKMQIENDTCKIMSIYYLVIIMLIVVGITAIGISLYSRIRMSSTKIAYLRAIGMSLSQITGLILKQNMFYPVIGAVCAVIPVGLCQCMFEYINHQINTGAWFSFGIIEYRPPWYFFVPHWYNLFSYHPVATLVILTLIMMALILLVTIPQILYVRKQRVVEDLEKVSF